MAKRKRQEKIPRWIRERKPPPYPDAFRHFVERIAPRTCCVLHCEAHDRLLASVRAPAGHCLLCGAQGAWRAGWPPRDAPVSRPCRDSVAETDLPVYYDLCERCHQAPGTPAQVDSLMRQRQAALREVASGSDVAQLDWLLRQRQPCKLCGTLPAPYKGIFQPEKPEIWGGTPEKVRLLIYGLCEQCFALPDKALRVEACFARDLTGRRN